MHNPHSTNKGMSRLSILNRLLSVNKIAILMNMAAIEKRKKRSVVESTPFSVKVLTNMPVDPNIIPAMIGNIKYIFFIISRIFYNLIMLNIFISYFIKFYPFI